jgi:hypothetical protein
MSSAPEPAASQRHSDSVNETEPLDRNAVISRITPPNSSKSTAYYLARRLYVVFNDVGLGPHIPSDWLQPGPEGGLSFRSLSLREADRLVLAIEDLAQGGPPSTTVNPDQLRLF